jgi:ligand-binding SRPBCC domain-containing protein
VFRWHERPDALRDLLPFRRWTRIEQRSGGLEDGGLVTVSFGTGARRLRMEARHFGFIAGEQFCDEQVRGPFAVWRHRHRVERLDAGRCLYEDRVEYALPGPRVLQRLADPFVRLMMWLAFAHRHHVVRKSCAPPRVHRRWQAF